MLVELSQEALVVPTLRAVTAQLVGLPVTVRVLRQPPSAGDLQAQLGRARQALRASPRALAAFWCTLASPERAFLYLSTQEGDRVVLRSIEGLDAAARLEAISLILGQAVRALLAGGTIGVHASEVPRPPPRVIKTPRRPASLPARPQPPVPRPQSPVPREARHGLAVEAAYTLEGFSRAPAVSHGIWGALLWRIRPRWTLLAGFNYSVPLRAESAQATLRLQRYPAQLGARGHFRVGRLYLGAGLALRVEYALHRTTSRIAWPSTDRDDLLWALVPALGLEVRLTDRLRGVFGACALVYLNNQKYIVSGEGVREVVLAPFPLRPQLTLGLVVDLF